METFKTVSYSYPTSPNAKKYGFYKTGCYTVETITDEKPPKSLAAFATKKEAVAFAETLKYRFHWLYLKYPLS